MPRRVLSSLLLVLVVGWWSGVCLATNPTAASSQYLTIGVGDTVMIIAGQTSPNAFVEVADFGTIVGATSADGAGNFSLTLPAQNAGIHKPSVFVVDTEGRTSDTVLQPVSLFDHFITTVQFFMPPTISLASSSIPKGNIVEFTGQAVPMGSVYLLIDNLFSTTAVVDSNGLWGYSLDSTGLILGTHNVTAITGNSLGQTSAATRKLNFNITAAGATTPSPTPATSGGTGSSPTPRPIRHVTSSPSARPVSNTPLVVVAEPVVPILPSAPTVQLPVVVKEGEPPFRIQIDWGDGKIDEYVADSKAVTLNHPYAKPGQYIVKMYILETSGKFLQNQWTITMESSLTQINRLLQIALMVGFIIALLEVEYRQRKNRIGKKEEAVLL